MPTKTRAARPLVRARTPSTFSRRVTSSGRARSDRLVGSGRKLAGRRRGSGGGLWCGIGEQPRAHERPAHPRGRTHTPKREREATWC
jgi:hypothetical protein